MIIESDLNNCPEPVRRYLTKAGVIDSKRKTYAQIFHNGEFRMKPKQRWFPIQGNYHFKPMDPSFEWKALIQIFPLISISVKDEYKDGVGRSVVKFASIFKIADNLVHK